VRWHHPARARGRIYRPIMQAPAGFHSTPAAGATGERFRLVRVRLGFKRPALMRCAEASLSGRAPSTSVAMPSVTSHRANASMAMAMEPEVQSTKENRDSCDRAELSTCGPLDERNKQEPDGQEAQCEEEQRRKLRNAHFDSWPMSPARRSRPSNQTVEVIFEPALSAFARGLSADPIRIPRASK
jgi:hypothetical protein